MRLLRVCLFCALLLRTDGKTIGELSGAAGRLLHVDDGNFSRQDHMKQEPFQEQQQVLEALPGSAFDLKVQVTDVLSRQYLSEAAVDVYINYTRTNSAVTGEDGAALLHVPYHSGLPLTVVASKDGYISTLLPCTTNRMPIFSSVTMTLHGRNQGNVWLFDDSVVITGRTSDSSSQPTVRFPKSLLNVTLSSNSTSVTAFLTVPKVTSEPDGFFNTLGVMSSKSGYVSVELSPVAAVSVQLFSGDTELHVSGPVQISLGVPDSCGLQTSNVVPAWFFNRTTGGWMRKGLGQVTSVEGRLVWTFTAPHLGYWIAAPLSSTRGFFGLAVPMDFILRHSFFLMVLSGGLLLIVICLLLGFICYCRSAPSEKKAMKILTVSKKDQTTSTCDDEAFGASSRRGFHPQDGPNQPFTENGDNQHNSSFISMHSNNIIANPNVAITLECNELELNTDLNDLTCSHKTSDQIRLPAS
ncbi:protein FAM171B-like, partial [Stegastes partitus]|uniref:Protein FAM171B-like n=1 Tax=Stegastes partitus TaxID=144197 RepID=A0A9Y4NSR0_9TELE